MLPSTTVLAQELEISCTKTENTFYEFQRQHFFGAIEQCYLAVNVSIIFFHSFSFVSEQLGAVPEFSNLGSLFKSSSLPVELTESETEYVVQCVKHCFGRYLVFQVIFSQIVMEIKQNTYTNLKDLKKYCRSVFEK